MDIAQAPFNTSLMGVIRGVADSMNIKLSTPNLYGRSGHAFMMNIHEAICPSGPYCWNIDPFIALLENCGIRMKKHGFFSAESTLEQRSALETTIKQELGKGNPCSVVNLDYQLITGFDEAGFNCTQPWEMDFPPSRLSFGNWAEWKDEIHACFFSFERVTPSDPNTAFLRSLQFIQNLNGNSAGFTIPPYSCGLSAFNVWVEGVNRGYGKEHGNWWNGTVWSECRKQAALYFQEISEELPIYAYNALKLRDLFDQIGDLLLDVSSKELDDKPKIEKLLKAGKLEKEALGLVTKLLDEGNKDESVTY